MPPSYLQYMRAGNGAEFRYGAKVAQLPKFDGQEIMDDRSASWIMKRVFEATLNLASCLKEKYGRSVNDFGLAVHRGRQTPFSIANRDVPALVLTITDNGVVETDHFIPGCGKRLPGKCVDVARTLYDGLKRLGRHAPYFEMQVESSFMLLRWRGEYSDWETGLSLTWKINWKTSAEGIAVGSLEAFSIIGITATELATAEEVGLEAEDDDAQSLVKSATKPSLASAAAQTSEASSVLQQSMQQSAGATPVKIESENQPSLFSVGTAPSAPSSD
ncbi:hypothetical protein NCC49_003282 [Naganishia albida]|nr:hypothetical protein NCC49_003282 [Naganishia albida]